VRAYGHKKPPPGRPTAGGLACRQRRPLCPWRAAAACHSGACHSPNRAGIACSQSHHAHQCACRLVFAAGPHATERLQPDHGCSTALPHGGPCSVVAAIAADRLRSPGRNGARSSRGPARDGARPARPRIQRRGTLRKAATASTGKTVQRARAEPPPNAVRYSPTSPACPNPWTCNVCRHR